jgi:hypothetical protein
MPDVPSAQSITASFGGTDLGKVIGFTGEYSVASAYDSTSSGATIIGTGSNSRVRRQIDPTIVDPGRMDFRALGDAVFSRSDIGKKASLVFYLNGNTLTVTAFLANYRLEGQRGELLESSYSFQFTGVD